MFSPIETGTIAEFFGFTTLSEGLPVDQCNPKAIANPEGRQYSKVLATGKITVNFNVTQRNLTKHGFIVGEE